MNKIWIFKVIIKVVFKINPNFHDIEKIYIFRQDRVVLVQRLKLDVLKSHILLSSTTSKVK